MIYVAILAGGKGTRMGNTNMPKQFLYLGSKPIIIHTIEKFILNRNIDKIIVVTPKEWLLHTKDIIKNYILQPYISKVLICEGGSDRNESIIEGINFIDSNFGMNDDDIIITHDAVRPFLSNRIIEENIKNVSEFGAVNTVIPATDTIVESVDGKKINNIPIRSIMYQGQTPQTFNIKKLKYLYDKLTNNEKEIMTDAAKIFCIKGEPVSLVMGDISNIKITTQYDFKIANELLKVK